MKLGIVGLPNVGKSTLFNAMTKAGAESANYPFCTIDPNVGIVTVPDYRLIKLAEMYKPKKVTPAIIEFVDIAGLVKGASKGEGLGNKFLSHIREVDAIVHVVRCFDDENIVHVDGSLGSGRDIETINFELIFSDIEMLERRIERTSKSAKSGEKKLKLELEFLIKLKAELEKGIPVRNMSFDDNEKLMLREIQLLTKKPVIYAANVSEDDINNMDNRHLTDLFEIANKDKAEVIVVSAGIEEEVSTLDDDDKKEFLNELGIKESGLDKLIHSSYRILGLISFLTAGETEVRAWTIVKGTKAPQAAGKIHTDFEKGFIRAEIISYDELINCGSESAAKDKGLMRLEGKEYTVKDGDVIHFRFNV
jgi:GTP-binding protein YchF